MKNFWSITKEVLKWLGLALLVVIVAGIVYLAVIWRKPLGPPLELPTRTPTAEGAIPSATVESLTSTTAPEPTATEVPATATPAPVCGGPETMLILFVGTDARVSRSLYGLADVIRIIKVDFVNLQIDALDIPRAINVDFPGVNSSRYGCQEARPDGPLNQAYFYGTEGMGCSDVPGLGAGLLAHTLDANFGVQVENYFAVDMITFGRAIDAVGGVPIYVFQTIDDRQRAGLPAVPIYGYFEAGNHWLSGIEAVRYARIRSIGGIFGRHDRQNEILVQLRERILQPSVVSAIPDLVDVFIGSVVTDLSLEQISQLSCLGLQLTMDDVNFQGLSPDLFVEGYNQWGWSALFADIDVISGLITDFVEGGLVPPTE